MKLVNACSARSRSTNAVRVDAQRIVTSPVEPAPSAASSSNDWTSTISGRGGSSPDCARASTSRPRAIRASRLHSPVMWLRKRSRSSGSSFAPDSRACAAAPARQLRRDLRSRVAAVDRLHHHDHAVPVPARSLEWCERNRAVDRSTATVDGLQPEMPRLAIALGERAANRVPEPLEWQPDVEVEEVPPDDFVRSEPPEISGATVPCLDL